MNSATSRTSLATAGSDGFWFFDGGTLELSGVFGGRPSLASSSATRATSAAFCATSASIRASSAAIKASLSAKSEGGVIHRLTHIREAAATKNVSRVFPRLMDGRSPTMLAAAPMGGRRVPLRRDGVLREQPARTRLLATTGRAKARSIRNWCVNA